MLIKLTFKKKRCFSATYKTGKLLIKLTHQKYSLFISNLDFVYDVKFINIAQKLTKFSINFFYPDTVITTYFTSIRVRPLVHILLRLILFTNTAMTDISADKGGQQEVNIIP